MNHDVFRVQIYRHDGGWAFDDEARGLVAEALVEGADTLVDLIAAHFDWSGLDRFWLQFSDSPSRFTFGLHKLGEARDGAHYVVAGPLFEGHKVWLCSALACYFDELPRRLTFEVSPLS